ncbi:MAG TPA: hypothetical protein VKV95_09740 [Terriglobia bacterium]|nr:hypothetical protein [Terriglobia bacterium]
MSHRICASAIIRISFVVFCVALFAATSIQAWPAQQIRTVPGQQEVVRVPSVSEPWSVTVGRVTESPAPLPWHIGHYPGFREAKRQANERHKALTSAGARPQSGAAFIGPQNEQAPAVGTTRQPALSSTTSGVVFDGPSQADTREFPPDSQIAAGPNYVVVAVNSLLAIYDKSGNLQGSFQNFSSFPGGEGEVLFLEIPFCRTRFTATARELRPA